MTMFTVTERRTPHRLIETEKSRNALATVSGTGTLSNHSASLRFSRFGGRLRIPRDEGHRFQGKGTTCCGLGLADLLQRFVPTPDRRTRLPYHVGLGILLRSVLTEREPLYRLGEVVETFAPEGFGLTEEQAHGLADDAIGRALDHLFDADRGSLLTEIVLAATERFDLSLEELHNDSTTVKFTGQYKEAKGRSLRGKKAPFFTYGYSKDHRPDLKQLLP